MKGVGQQVAQDGPYQLWIGHRDDRCEVTAHPEVGGHRDEFGERGVYEGFQVDWLWVMLGGNVESFQLCQRVQKL